MSTYTFLSDPSHGWLRVPLIELYNLGILDKISGCSYLFSKYVYLEEDCDAQKFINACKVNDKPFLIKSNPQANNQSRIRSYQRFTPEDAIKVLRELYPLNREFKL